MKAKSLRFAENQLALPPLFRIFKKNFFNTCYWWCKAARGLWRVHAKYVLTDIQISRLPQLHERIANIPRADTHGKISRILYFLSTFFFGNFAVYLNSTFPFFFIPFASDRRFLWISALRSNGKLFQLAAQKSNNFEWISIGKFDLTKEFIL